MNHFSDKVNLIWDIADTLRSPYRPPEYRKVMLPMTVLRRLDCVLAPTKPQVLVTQKQWSNKAADALLRKAACQTFYNTSKLDFDNPNLQQAGAANTRDDFAYARNQHLEELVVNRMDRNGGQADMFFANPEVRTVIQNWMLAGSTTTSAPSRHPNIHKYPHTVSNHLPPSTPESPKPPLYPQSRTALRPVHSRATLCPLSVK
jgi:hypothetical protein